jgi:hypothetical protein
MYAKQKDYDFGQGIWDKMWPIVTIHGICSKRWGTGGKSNGEYIRNTILNIIGNM